MTTLTPEEIAEALTELPGWSSVTGNTAAIRREVTAPTFLTAIRIVDQVAEAAEAADHHPDIDIRYRKLRFTLSTHSAGGVTTADINLATQINTIATTHDAT